MTNTPLHWTGSNFRALMTSELMCPHCLRRLRPSGVRCEPDAISIICENCHQDVVRVEFSLAEPVL
jgi:hypothetical protein